MGFDGTQRSVGGTDGLVGPPATAFASGWKREAWQTMADDRKDRTSPQHEYASMAGCLPRVFWMGVGNIALVMAALSIYASTGWSIADLAFWVIVGLLVGARYIDIARYKGTTVDGEPATSAHFKRYALMLLVVSVVVWAAARLLGPGFAGVT